MRIRLAQLISGGGTTMQAIIRACKEDPGLGIDPVLVIASTEDAGGIAKAKNEEVPVFVRRRRDYPSAEHYGAELVRLLDSYKVNLVGQYGWLAWTPPNVVATYRGRMINQHPGPLDPGYPDFGGKGMFGRRVHAARLMFARETGEWWTEATAQYVDEYYDMGAVIRRTIVEIKSDDTVDSLQARVLPVEHQVQIDTLRLFAKGQDRALIRTNRLVAAHHVSLLEKAKRIAISEYPNG